MMEKRLQGLRNRLEQLDWPSKYMFKFIVPAGQVSKVVRILPGENITTRESRKGNYVSITSTTTIESEEVVLQVYRDASKVKGIIAL